MKKIFLFILLVSSISTIYCQNWPSTDTWWAYRLTGSGSTKYEYLNVIGDTMVNNQIAKKIESTIFEYLLDLETGEEVLIDHKKSNNYILLLNLNDSIYFRYAEEWRFLYSFHLEIGESYELQGIDSTKCFDIATETEFMLPNSNTLEVIDIKTYEFVDFVVEEICLSEPNHWSFGTSGILKNIGPKENFLPKPNCEAINYFVASDGLNCYSSPETGLLFVDEFNLKVCNEMQTVKIENHVYSNDFKKLEMYPNPSKDIIKFNIESKKPRSLKIYNSLGKNVMSKHIKEDLINIEQLENGLYYINLKVDKDLFIGSFVKY